ncbi:MAG TPA: LarC family nickel insertion protein, partial [Acidimicrobiales bacterium]|nr:LarC family nickel insertion protein [Acidimicrobiales bacterium]
MSGAGAPDAPGTTRSAGAPDADAAGALSGAGTGRRVAWFHCFAGIAGDMALGSLLDAGADLAEVRRLLERLPLGGWSLEAVPVLRGGIAATQVLVEVDDDGTERRLGDVLAILDAAALPSRVHDRAAATFAALAAVESRLHRKPPDGVHFHELGGHDTIVDVVGTAAALEVLDVDEVTSSVVRTGNGVVRAAHGILPNPSPAVLELLAGAPVAGLDVPLELTTPTGAAILRAIGSGFGPMPAMTLEATGYGAGSRELESMPNCTQVVLGRATHAGPGGPSLLGTAGVAGTAG